MEMVAGSGWNSTPTGRLELIIALTTKDEKDDDDVILSILECIVLLGNFSE
jgi:hypothetical protein